MATGTVAPYWDEQHFDDNGNPLSGGLLYTYAAGTSTLQATYSDYALTIPNANPIVLDSGGRCTSYWSATSFKCVLKTSASVTVRTRDNIPANAAFNVNLDVQGTAGEALTAGDGAYLSGGDGGLVAGRWYKWDADFTYASSDATDIAMVVNDIASGAVGSFRQGGIATKTGLSAGTDYFISATAGALTSTAPTNRRLVGKADTSSSIDLAFGPKASEVTALAGNADNGVNDFRLTLTTGVPVTTADVTGASAVTIFCTPSGRGNRLALYDSAGVATVYTSAQFSIAVPATTVTMYDIFAFSNSGVPTLELLAWTNDTTRATAIVLTTTGTYTKSGDLTRRYLGSFRTTGVSGQTEDSYAKRYLWNYYNRVNRPMRVLEATDSWTYTTATWRQANAATTNQVDIVVGVAEETLDVMAFVSSSNANANVIRAIAIGEDSTTVPTTGNIFGPNLGLAVASDGVWHTADFLTIPAVGRHFYAWLEYSVASGTTAWVGDNGSTLTQSGMRAMWRN